MLGVMAQAPWSAWDSVAVPEWARREAHLLESHRTCRPGRPCAVQGRHRGRQGYRPGVAGRAEDARVVLVLLPGMGWGRTVSTRPADVLPAKI